MTATVRESTLLPAPTITDNGDYLTLSPRRFIYEGRDYAADENILDHQQIPAYGDQLRVGGRWFYCNSRQWTQGTPENGEVQCGYTTEPPQSATDADFKHFSYTYKKVQEKIPIFHLEKYWHARDDGSNGEVERIKWVKSYIEDVYTEWPTLNCTVTRTGGFVINPTLGNGNWDNTGVVNDIKALQRQIGHAHRFARFTEEDLWIMQPPSLTQTALNRYQISYAWLLDPGCGGVNIPNVDRSEFLIAPPRPPWHRYFEVASNVLDTIETTPEQIRPRIMLVNAMPEKVWDSAGNEVPNPLYTPGAWSTLPGEPLS